VIDGDTIVVGESETIRLIGVDTPEIYHPLKPVQYFADAASVYVKGIVLGKKVRLEYDQEKTDKYGRTLAYVYLENGEMLNAEIIKNGYGFAYTKYPFKYMEEFRNYEREARERGLGLWGNQGIEEYRWLLAQKREPFIVYEMANNWWAIRYKSFVKVRITIDDLKTELERLRLWINELNKRDLREQLLQNGWIEESGNEKRDSY
jgi:micrococcal nuclease